MKDEEEIQTQPQNGRLFMTTPQPVTVAAPPPPPQQILTLALPIQLPRTTTGGGGGGGRDDCWSEGATSTLINAWGERYLELSRGNLKQKHWQDVADIVSSREDYTKPPKTDVQCKNRIDTLKKKYKTETAKIASGQGPSMWVFYHRLDHLIRTNAANIPVGIPVDVGNQQQRQQQQYQRQRPMDWNSSSEETPPSPDSTDSLPPESFNRKRPRLERKLNSDPFRQNAGKGKGRGWGNSMRELSQAILEFGEAFERTETSKLQQMVEMEKQRMGFAKDMEVQRMQLFMKTQLELTQLKNGNHHHNINNKRNTCD